ncbi:MAG: ribosome hibernation-promoting factor, HPF/YfiA family [Actinomycetota bacterium]
MDIKVHGKHNHISDSLDRFAQEKMSKLGKYLPTISGIEIELYEEGKRKDLCCHCEVTVTADGPVFRAKTSAGDHKACIDIAFDRLKGQLADFNRKRSGKPAHARHANHAQRASIEELQAALADEVDTAS